MRQARMYAETIKLMFNHKDLDWTILIPSLYTSYLYRGEQNQENQEKSSNYKRLVSKEVQKARKAAGEAVAKQILARAEKFVAINKQQIAGISSQTAG